MRAGVVTKASRGSNADHAIRSCPRIPDEITAVRGGAGSTRAAAKHADHHRVSRLSADGVHGPLERAGCVRIVPKAVSRSAIAATGTIA